MDKGMSPRKEIAMGLSSAKKEVAGSGKKVVKNLKCGGKVKKMSNGGKAKKGCC